jgi:hypothetical protein
MMIPLDGPGEGTRAGGQLWSSCGSGLLRAYLANPGGRLDSPQSMTRFVDDGRAAASIVGLDLMLQLATRNWSAADQTPSPRAAPHNCRKSSQRK